MSSGRFRFMARLTRISRVPWRAKLAEHVLGRVGVRGQPGQERRASRGIPASRMPATRLADVAGLEHVVVDHGLGAAAADTASATAWRSIPLPIRSIRPRAACWASASVKRLLVERLAHDHLVDAEGLERHRALRRSSRVEMPPAAVMRRPLARAICSMPAMFGPDQRAVAHHVGVLDARHAPRLHPHRQVEGVDGRDLLPARHARPSLPSRRGPPPPPRATGARPPARRRARRRPRCRRSRGRRPRSR